MMMRLRPRLLRALAPLVGVVLLANPASSRQCPTCNLTAGSGEQFFNVTCSAVARLVADGKATCAVVQASECACCNFCDAAAAYAVYKNCSESVPGGSKECNFCVGSHYAQSDEVQSSCDEEPLSLLAAALLSFFLGAFGGGYLYYGFDVTGGVMCALALLATVFLCLTRPISSAQKLRKEHGRSTTHDLFARDRAAEQAIADARRAANRSRRRPPPRRVTTATSACSAASGRSNDSEPFDFENDLDGDLLMASDRDDDFAHRDNGASDAGDSDNDNGDAGRAGDSDSDNDENGSDGNGGGDQHAGLHVATGRGSLRNLFRTVPTGVSESDAAGLEAIADTDADDDDGDGDAEKGHGGGGGGGGPGNAHNTGARRVSPVRRRRLAMFYLQRIGVVASAGFALWGLATFGMILAHYLLPAPNSVGVYCPIVC